MTCRACGGTCDPVFEMAPMPLAAAFAATEAEAKACPRYPLTWSRCRVCGLVNVSPDIPDETLYRHYGYAASTVPGLVRHHREYAEFLASQHRGKVRLLEIGSNDGVLLRQLPPDWEVLGIDPSDVESPGLPRYREPFNFGLSQIVGKFDIVTSSNAFAHFSGIEEAIASIANCLKADGTAYIEVHDLVATLATGQWDTIYHEHKVEWSVESLRLAFGQYGLRMVEVARLPLHGGLIRATFRKGRAAEAPAPGWVDFSGLVSAYAHRQEDAPSLPPGAVAYGAAARASVYLNQVETSVTRVIDGSPRRAGKFIPGVGLPILPPEDFDDPPAALITAWNHAPDIKARHPGYDRWVSAW